MRRLMVVAGVLALLATATAAVQSTMVSAGGASRYGLTADLSGSSEVGGGDPDGAGSAYVRVDPVGGLVCWTISAENLGAITAAHIHSGEEGENGAVVLELVGGLDNCTTAAPLLAQQILAAPDTFYVNMHTSAFPGGAIRGQLGITVTGVDDVVLGIDGVLSLREAFNTANNDGTASTITLGLDRTYLLTTCGADDNTNVVGDLDHTSAQSLAIVGGGSTIEQTCNDARVLHNTNGGNTVNIENLTVTGGDAVGALPHDGGGGIYVQGNLTLTDSVVTLNAATGVGGGAHATGNLTVTRSYIANNAGSEGGGLRGGSLLSLVSSTVVGNDAGNEGGGLSGGDVDLQFSTLASNTSDSASHITAGTITSLASILTDQLGGGTACAAGISSSTGGGNYVHSSSPGDCNFGGGTDIVTTTPPDLRPLFPAVPGSTSAFIPRRGSPVLERVLGSLSTCTTNDDQRSLDRPQSNDCDAGSIELEACDGFFSDVAATSQFCNEIGWMAATGVSTGFPNGTYRPSPAVSRSAMSAFMYRLASAPSFDDPSSPTFIDVPTTAQFFTEIEWMNSQGITTGSPSGSNTYKPSAAVSRQAMSAFMYRLAGEPPFSNPGTPTFIDVPTSNAFFHEIEWMRAEAITTGSPSGSNTYKPSAAVSRQAMSAFMYRLADGLLPGQ